MHGVSDTAIRKQAKKLNWTRSIASGSHREPPPRATPAPAEKVDVESIVARAADADPVELVKAGRVIIEMLMRELAAESTNIDFLEQIIDEETEGDRSPRRREALMKAASLPVRTAAAKNLATALRTLADAAPGKKDDAKEKARTAGAGTEWGDDLDFGTARN